jgi:hypothetical protein
MLQKICKWNETIYSAILILSRSFLKQTFIPTCQQKSFLCLDPLGKNDSDVRQHYVCEQFFPL